MLARHVVLASLACLATCRVQRSFKIENDRFMLDGKQIQLLSGSVHYQRIHPAYWEDRLLRVKSLGLNAIQTYVPWNLHEPFPGQFEWSGFADIDRFLNLAQKLDLLVLLRPGPYICAEWDFGGFPWWLSSSAVAGGGTMKLRSHDAKYLAHVERWWNVLLGRLAPFLYSRGGPVIMVQIENEFGFVGPDLPYLKELLRIAREILGDDVIIYTTDPPPRLANGTIPGPDVYTAVDFGAGWFDLNWAFGQQRAFNAPGRSPPLCTEFYTGWLTHWGEPMANTSLDVFIKGLNGIMDYGGGWGSFNLYMAHGGTNFGYGAGGGVDKDKYVACITSYDYDAPISEAGDYGQPGIGGPNRYQAIRDAIQAHTGKTPIPAPPPPKVVAYGSVPLSQSAVLTQQLGALASHAGISARVPLHMEEYGQQGGVILYRTFVPAAELAADSVLDLGSPVRDSAQVLLDGKRVGSLDRNGSPKLTLAAPARASWGPRASRGSHETDTVALDIVVQAIGRSNDGYMFDRKGLVSPSVTLNGKKLTGWHVYPLPLTDLTSISFSFASNAQGGAPEPATEGPVFYRGVLQVVSNEASGFPADTYLSVKGWGKGLAFVNGFNLGWYWPTAGPTNTMYVPGPVLKVGANEVVLLEVDAAPSSPAVSFLDQADFYGPGGELRVRRGPTPTERRGHMLRHVADMASTS